MKILIEFRFGGQFTMKYLIYCGLAFIGFLLFMPRTGDTAIRNVPLLILIISVIALYYIIKYLNTIVFSKKIKKLLSDVNMNLKNLNVLFEKGYIIAEDSNNVYNICFLIRKKSYYRYHFCAPNSIELYKSTFAVNKSNKAGTIARGAVETQKVGTQKIVYKTFTTNKTQKYFVIFNQLPDIISDSINREKLGNGDHICSSNVLLYDIQGFEKAFNLKKE